MFGNNQQFKKDFAGGQQLAVNSIFSTIQGEGPYAGRPAIFLRMAQCNLACTFCDTEFERSRIYNPYELTQAIYDVLVKSLGNPTLLVVTGGEPLLQDLAPFFDVFLKRFKDWDIQIETAGTVWQDSLEPFMGDVSLVCSPKTPKVHKKIHEHCTHWKYIVRNGWISYDDGLPDMPTQPGLTKRVKLARPNPDDLRKMHIYVQPCDEQDAYKNEGNMKFASELAMFYNYKLSLQLHKIVGLE